MAHSLVPLKPWNDDLISGFIKLLFPALLCFALGVTGRAGDLSSTTDVAHIVPLNSQWFKMVTSQGGVTKFARDPESPYGLMGPDNWDGEIQGRSILIMNGPDEGYRFFDGYLAETLSNGVSKRLQRPQAHVDDMSFLGLWKPDADAVRMRDVKDIWSGSGRLCLWFKNPNLAATLFAEIGLLFSCLVVLCRLKWFVVFGISGGMASFYFLLRTESRGGMMAFVIGLSIVLLCSFIHRFSWKKLVVSTIVVILILGGVFLFGNTERYTRQIISQSGKDSRLTVWREVPSMMADSPKGWGVGRSGDAYVKWYQKDCSVLFKNMISGHLTCLVEFGSIGRFLYIFGWLFILSISSCYAWRKRNPLPLSLIVAFFVAGIFNPVFSCAELWVLPLVSCAVLLKVRRNRWGKLSILCGILAGVLLMVVLVVGKNIRNHRAIVFSGSRDSVILNGPNPSIWIVDDDFTLHNGYWWLPGREMRAFYSCHPKASAIGYTESLDEIPDTCKRLVLIGRKGMEYLRRFARNNLKREIPAEIIFVSPSFSATLIPPALVDSASVKMIQGDFAARLTDAYNSIPSWMSIIPGAELYLPHWIEYALGIKNPK